MNTSEQKRMIAERFGPEVAERWAEQHADETDEAKERVWRCSHCGTRTNGNDLRVPCRVCGVGGKRYLEVPA